MAILDFPQDTSQSPYVANGVTYEWDGEKWTAVFEGGGSGGGASVHVGTNPPTGTPTEGDLWWQDEEARLYVYYTDTDSSQWVDASPGGASTDGGGGGTVGNLQQVTDNGNSTTNDVLAQDFFSRTDSLPSTTNPGFYVGGGNGIYISSDSTSGSATLWQGFSTDAGDQTSRINVDGGASFASGDITLNADGSASFGGRIDALDSVYVGSKGSDVLAISDGTGRVELSCENWGSGGSAALSIAPANGTSKVFGLSDVGLFIDNTDVTSSPNIGLYSAGVIQVSRDSVGEAIGIYQGGTDAANNKILLKTDGSGEFAGNVFSETGLRARGANSSIKVRQDGDGEVAFAVAQGSTLTEDSTIKFNGNGSAWFDGNVDLGDYNDVSADAAGGSRLYNSGRLFLRRVGQGNTSDAIRLTNGTGNDYTFKVTTDGTISTTSGASFAGSVSVESPTLPISAKRTGGSGTDMLIRAIGTAGEQACFGVFNDCSLALGNGTDAISGAGGTINLNGADGTASFAGNVDVGSIDLYKKGFIDVYQKTTGTAETLYRGVSDVGGDGTTQFEVFTNGSADFAGGDATIDSAGNVSLNGYVFSNRTSASNTCFRGTLNGATTFEVEATGKTIFGSDPDNQAYIASTGDLVATRTSAASTVLIGQQNGVTTSRIFAGGSAEFANTLTVKVPNDTSGFKVDNSNDKNTVVCWVDSTGDGEVDIKDNTGAPQIRLYGKDGSATFVGTVTDNTSDIKFKENIVDATSQLADVIALRLRSWNWKSDAIGTETRKARHTTGLVAQEAETVDSKLVYDVGEGDDSFKAIDYKVLTMKLLGAVQELEAARPTHVSFDGSGGDDFDFSTAKIASHNVASVERTAKGMFTITFTTPFASDKYTAVATAGDENHTGTGASPRCVNVVARTANSLDIVVERSDDAVQDDDGYISVFIAQ